MDPRAARKWLAGALEEDLTLFALLGQAPEQLRVLDRLCRYYPALGICHLLISGDPVKMRECLVRSAYARLHQLRLGSHQSPLPRQSALSFNPGLLSALAAGHWPLIEQLTVLSPADWQKHGEYEDDFCYYRILLLLSAETPDRSVIEGLLRRFGQALEGKKTPRLRLCTGLTQIDADGFADAFDDYLRERQEELDEKALRLGEEDADFAAYWMSRFVDVEAVAVLTLAERFGIEPAGPFPLVPPGSRMRGPCPNFPDPFALLEAAR